MWGAIGDAITEGVFSASAWFVEMLAAAMAGFVGWTLHTVFAVTDPNMGAGFLWLWASRTFTIAIPITGIFMAAQIMTASVRARQVSGVKEALLGSAAAVFGTMLALPLIQMLVVAIDGLADGFLTLMQADIVSFGDTISGFLNLSQSPAGQELLASQKENANVAAMAPGAGLILLLVSVVIGFIGAFFLAFALLLRTNLLYIAVVAVPIALAALAFEPTRGWPRKLLSAIVALAFGKLAIVIVIGIGMAALQDSVWDAESISGVIGGVMTTATLLLVAAFMPMLAFRFFDFVGGEALSAATGAGSAAMSGVVGGGKMLAGAIAAGSAALTGGASAAAAGAGAAAGSGGGAAAAADAGTSAAAGVADAGSGGGSPGLGSSPSEADGVAPGGESPEAGGPASTDESSAAGGGPPASSGDSAVVAGDESSPAQAGDSAQAAPQTPDGETPVEDAPVPSSPVEIDSDTAVAASAAAMVRDDAASIAQAAPLTGEEADA